MRLEGREIVCLGTADWETELPINQHQLMRRLARRNRVLADEVTVAALDPLDYETMRLTARPVRGFGLLEPIAVRRR